MQSEYFFSVYSQLYILLNIIMTAYIYHICLSRRQTYIHRHMFIVTQSKNNNFHSIISALLFDNRMKESKRKKMRKTIKKVSCSVTICKTILFYYTLTNINKYISLSDFIYILYRTIINVFFCSFISSLLRKKVFRFYFLYISVGHSQKLKHLYGIKRNENFKK